MDELKLKLSTKLMRGIVAKLLSKMLQTKLGYKVDIQLNELDVTISNGVAHVHTSIEGQIKYDDLMSVVKKIDL